MPDRPDPNRTVPWTDADLARLNAATPATPVDALPDDASIGEVRGAYADAMAEIAALREALADIVQDYDRPAIPLQVTGSRYFAEQRAAAEERYQRQKRGWAQARNLLNATPPASSDEPK